MSLALCAYKKEEEEEEEEELMGPTILSKVIGAVKDKTSISLAQVLAHDSPNLEIAIVRATSHDQVPTEERRAAEVLLLASLSRANAAACVRALARRLSRTRNWVVALKTLCLLSRALTPEGGPFLLPEALAAARSGLRLAVLTRTCNAPPHCSSFLRSFALFLDQRLAKRSSSHAHHLLDGISQAQRTLDKVIATAPAREARKQRLVQIALYLVLRESFDLYKEISIGLSLLLGEFPSQPSWTRITTYRALAKASAQFEELEKFHNLCRSLGVGRHPEFPVLRKIPRAELLSAREKLRF